jgi:hypothetical protein
MRFVLLGCLATDLIAQTALSSLVLVIYFLEQLFRTWSINGNVAPMLELGMQLLVVNIILAHHLITANMIMVDKFVVLATIN